MMYNNQSPKKCRPQEMTDLEHSIIVQTSSDEECSQILKSPIKKRKQFLKEDDPGLLRSQLSSQSVEVVSKSISRRAIMSLSEDGESTEESIEIADLTSSSSDSGESSSSLFEQEGDSSEPLERVRRSSNGQKNSPLMIKPVAEVEHRSKKRLIPFSDSSQQRLILQSPSPVPLPVNPSAATPTSKRPKQWVSMIKKQVVPKSVLSSLPPTSSKKPVKIQACSPESVTKDIYNYVPSVDELAIKKSSRVQFENWVLIEGVTDKLCILTGPPGCGKVIFTSLVQL